MTYRFKLYRRILELKISTTAAVKHQHLKVKDTG